MFGAIVGALKGIGSGLASVGSSIGHGVQGLGGMMGKAFKAEGGGFDWDKLVSASEAFNKHMDPNSGVGQALTGINQGGRQLIGDMAKAHGEGAYKAAQAAGSKAAIPTITAEEAGLGSIGDTPIPTGPIGGSSPPYLRKPGSPLPDLPIGKPIDLGAMLPPVSVPSMPATIQSSTAVTEAAPAEDKFQKLMSGIQGMFSGQQEEKVYAPPPELGEPPAIPPLQPLTPLSLSGVEFDPVTGYVRTGGRPLSY